MARRSLAILVTTCLGAGVVRAQPAPEDKVDAKSLLRSGLRLFEARDYLGALAVFKDAYARFPSAKILLNIGTTLNLLDRKADAANAYQRYLDSPEADPAKRADVTAAIAEIDRGVGRLELAITPADAEVQIDDGDWEPAARVKIYRVTPGSFTVRARKDGYQSAARSESVALGASAPIVLALAPLPPPDVAGTSAGNLGDTDLLGIGTSDEADGRRSRLAAIALAHLDLPRGGGAARVGLGFDVAGPLQVQAAALIGPNTGAYAGATLSFLSGRIRPQVVAGMPVFFSDGARLGVRGGGGLELLITRHVSVLAELGVEVLLNPEDDIRKAVVIPAIGAAGRL